MKISYNFPLITLVFLFSFSCLNSFSQKKDTTSPKDTPQEYELTFYGNGNIQKALDNGEKIPASTGIGVNYTQKNEVKPILRIFKKLELDASINVASTVDTIVAKYDSTNIVTNSSDFGSSILTPLNSGQAVKISLRLDFKYYRAKFLEDIISGIKVKYVGSNRNWLARENNTNSKSIKSIQGTVSSLRIGIFHEFLPKDELDIYSINFGVYWAYNSIKGDIGQNKNEMIRKQILGSDRKTFKGPEVSLEIRLRNLRAEFAYSWLSSNVEIPGLTNGRLVTTISFVGGFGLNLNKSNNKPN